MEFNLQNNDTIEEIKSNWIAYLSSEVCEVSIESIIECKKAQIDELLNNATELDSKFNKLIFQDNPLLPTQKKVIDIIEQKKSKAGVLLIGNDFTEALIDWRFLQYIEKYDNPKDFLQTDETNRFVSEKEKIRTHEVLQALKYLNAAISEGVESLFFDDALDRLKRAEEIEDSDFAVLSKFGYIYLYSKNHLDFKKAEAYYLKSAKEAFVESTIYTNTEKRSKALTYFRFLALTNAAKSCFLQKNFGAAIQNVNEALKISPNSALLKFDLAKYLFFNNDFNEALLLFKELIMKNEFYLIRIFLDETLYQNKLIRNFLSETRDDYYKRIFSAIKYQEELLDRRSYVSRTLEDVKRSCLQNPSLYNLLEKDNFLANEFGAMNSQSDFSNDSEFSDMYSLREHVSSSNREFRKNRKNRKIFLFVCLIGGIFAGILAGIVLGEIVGWIRCFSIGEAEGSVFDGIRYESRKMLATYGAPIGLISGLIVYFKYRD